VTAVPVQVTSAAASAPFDVNAYMQLMAYSQMKAASDAAAAASNPVGASPAAAASPATRSYFSWDERSENILVELKTNDENRRFSLKQGSPGTQGISQRDRTENWKQVVEALHAQNVHVELKHAMTKWEGMRDKYRRIKQTLAKTGEGVDKDNFWKPYAALEALLAEGEEPAVSPYAAKEMGVRGPSPGAAASAAASAAAASTQGDSAAASASPFPLAAAEEEEDELINLTGTPSKRASPAAGTPRRSKKARMATSSGEDQILAELRAARAETMTVLERMATAFERYCARNNKE